MTAYLISSIAWALLGLLTGYVIGRSARAAAAIEGAAMTEPAAPATAPARVIGPWWSTWPPRRPTPDQVLGVLVVLLAIASVAVMSVSLSNQQAAIERASTSIRCLTEYNTQNIAATGAARQAAVIEREANRSILDQAFSGRLGPQSLAGWNAEVERADAVRAAQPYPAQRTCDGPQ